MAMMIMVMVAIRAYVPFSLMAFLMAIYFQKSSLISKPGFHMLSSPLSSPSPTKKAEAEKKRREIEENERRKIYAETEGKIYGQEKNYNEEDRSMYNSKEEEKEDEASGGEAPTICRDTEVYQNVDQVKIL